MNFWEFAAENPWSTFFLSVVVYYVLRVLLIFCINRPLRAMNIRKHGWPPQHCDADGDFRAATDECAEDTTGSRSKRR